MDKKSILKVAIDAIQGRVENYSKEQANEALRSALIDLNGGSNKINMKNFYRGHALFDLVQELIPAIIETGLREDNPLFDLVDYRNIAKGDVNEFIAEGVNELVVSNVAKGIQGVRRQRLMGREKIRIETEVRIIKVFEGLNRLLAGRITFNELVDSVSKSFNKQMYADKFSALESIGANTAGHMNANFVVTGTYDEERLVELIDRVEAMTGKTARIFGVRAALRKVRIESEGELAKSSKYDVGFYGKFNGTDMIVIKQAVNKDGTFILSPDRLYVLASDDKPIKFVNEGEGILVDKPATDNDDLTQEYVYAQAYGLGVLAAAPLGIYNIAGA